MNDDILNGLCDGTYRARWLREVLRSPQITESIKLLLIALAVGEMDAAGRVSVPREELATRIGRGKARISERLQEAVQRGFLVRASSGKKGNTAVYLAALDGSACADPIGDVEEPVKGPLTRTENDGGKGPTTRTRTKFGSGLTDALKDDQNNVSVRTDGRFDPDSVRVGGPKDEKKGPPTRAAKVVESVRGEVLEDSTGEGLLDIGEDAASRPTPKPPKRAKKPAVPKTSIPADFALTDEMRQWAAEKCPRVDIEIETQLFVRHFLDHPEIKRPGWLRSWEAWMLRQVKWDKERPAQPAAPGARRPARNAAEQRLADNLEVVAWAAEQDRLAAEKGLTQ